MNFTYVFQHCISKKNSVVENVNEFMSFGVCKIVIQIDAGV